MPRSSNPQTSSEPGGDPIERLILDLHNRNGMTRLRARRALKTAGATAVPRLIPETQNPDKQVRWEAMKTLVSLADFRSLKTFLSGLEDPDADVAWLAAEGLTRLGRAAWPGLLRAFLRHSDSMLWRKAVHHVLNSQRRYPGNQILIPFMTALEEGAPHEDAAVEALSLLRNLHAG